MLAVVYYLSPTGLFMCIPESVLATSSLKLTVKEIEDLASLTLIDLCCPLTQVSVVLSLNHCEYQLAIPVLGILLLVCVCCQ